MISYMAMYLMKMLYESAEEDSHDEMCEFPVADRQEWRPSGWWRSVRKILIPYLGLVVCSFVIFVLVLTLVILSGYSMLVGLLMAPLIFLILAVGMNILGKFYRKHEEKIDW